MPKGHSTNDEDDEFHEYKARVSGYQSISWQMIR